MGESANAIMDAAERRMRIGGFGGFSFREIAVDVGVKSSSVHYHFPTKENLAAAVVRRYTEDVARLIDGEMATEPDPRTVWTRVFRGTLHSEARMCPCTLMGAGALDLPPAVAAEIRHFYSMCVDKIVGAGLTLEAATEFLATITGAMVISVALGDLKAYDRATKELARTSVAAA